MGPISFFFLIKHKQNKNNFNENNITELKKQNSITKTVYFFFFFFTITKHSRKGKETNFNRNEKKEEAQEKLNLEKIMPRPKRSNSYNNIFIIPLESEQTKKKINKETGAIIE